MLVCQFRHSPGWCSLTALILPKGHAVVNSRLLTMRRKQQCRALLSTFPFQRHVLPVVAVSICHGRGRNGSIGIIPHRGWPQIGPCRSNSLSPLTSPRRQPALVADRVARYQVRSNTMRATRFPCAAAASNRGRNRASRPKMRPGAATKTMMASSKIRL